MLRCGNCGHENAGDARFCSHCGNRLEVVCEVCGTAAEPGDRFCRNCGSPLTEEVSPETGSAPQEDLSRYLPQELLAKLRAARDGRSMEGERRTVTMLFADIQGSTSTAEQLDPEDWAEIMNGAFEHLIAPIYRYEGTLAQLRGDAVLAFFGAPIAHEDDPVRALRAGLEMVEAMTVYSEEVEDRWGFPTHVRVGVNTGLVVVGAMGSDLRVEYTALGDAINVAARMEQTADPDSVRVTDHTLSLTGGFFETEELGPVEVKGKAEPVVSHRVLRYLGETQHGHQPAIVGRRAQLDSLGEARESVLAGSGRMTSIIAEAGVGKSRLVREHEVETAESVELVRRFDQTGDANWLSGSSKSYESSKPFSTIGETLNRWWSSGSGVVDHARIEEALSAEGLDDPDLAAYLGYISGVALPERATHFIGSLDTRVLNAKANEAVATYFEALEARRPTFVVLEDLHWSDDLSLALIESLMDLAETGPLGLILTMRPYRDEAAWKIPQVAERDHHHRHQKMELESLGIDESSNLLDSLVEIGGLSAEARQGILDRSEGNPLYIEQMAMAIREVGPDGLTEAFVPSSLTGLLTARLDRLEEHTRYVVQVASVLGSEFDRGMLEVLSDRSSLDDDITDILKRGILREAEGGSERLAFNHALIQEVAYETLLRRTRRELHRRVADTMIDADGRPDDIAHHLVAADEAEEAFPFLIEAGANASRSMALADAIEFFTTALDNIPVDANADLVQRAHEGLGEAYSLIPDLSQSAASYQRLYQYGKDNERPSAQVAALNRLAYATASLGADLDKASDYLTDARRIAEESNDEIGLAEYHMNACFVASLGGQMSEAVAHDEETVRLGERQGVDSIRLSGLVRRAMNYVALLDLERGLPAVETALREAREAGLEEATAVVELAGKVMVKRAQGDIRGALENAKRIRPTLERYGSFYLAMNLQGIGDCLYRLGNVEDALSAFVDVRRVAERSNQPFTAAAGVSGMALVYASAGMESDVPDLLAEAEERLAGPLGEFLASTVRGDLGFVSLLLGDAKRAMTEFEQGLNASSTTFFIERPRLLAGKALALSHQGENDDADRALAHAVEIVEEKSLGLYRSLLRYVGGEILLARGRHGEAGAQLEKAQTHALETGQRLLLLQILEARARIAEAEGRLTEAKNVRRQSRTVTDSIAEEIADRALRDGFRSRWLSEQAGTGVESSA